LDRAVETFAENPLMAGKIVTEEAPDPQYQDDPSAGGWKISQCATISTVHPVAYRIASWTSDSQNDRSHRDREFIAIYYSGLDRKARWDERRSVKHLHGSDSP
jgi:hypothetical protein